MLILVVKPSTCTILHILWFPSNKDTPLPNNSVLIREVSFGERQHYMYIHCHSVLAAKKKLCPI